MSNCHHAAAETYRVALGILGFLPLDRTGDKLRAPKFEHAAEQKRIMAAWDLVAPKDRLLLGVTATPNRSDEVGLSCVFQEMVYTYPLRQAIADGYLVPPVPFVVETKTSLDAVRITAGEFNQKDLALAVNTDVRTELAIAAWHEHAPGRPTIAFGVDVAHTKAIAAQCSAVGITAAYVSGDMPTEERRRIIRDFSDGAISVLTNCMVLTEGTDLPLVSCIIHMAPTQSASLYEQKTGRGLRPHGYKEDCIIIDVVDVTRKHSLVTLPTLYGLPAGLIPSKDKSMAETADDFDQFLKDHRGLNVAGMLAGKPRTLEQLRAMVTRVDAMAPRPASTVVAGRLVKWTQAGDRYRLEYAWEGTRERVEVARDPRGLWEAVLTTNRQSPKGGMMRDQRTLGNQITDERAALALAEGFLSAERKSIVRMASPDARWRKDAASPGQLELLARLGIAHTNAITKGEANDLIDQHKLGRR